LHSAHPPGTPADHHTHSGTADSPILHSAQHTLIILSIVVTSPSDGRLISEIGNVVCNMVYRFFSTPVTRST